MKNIIVISLMCSTILVHAQTSTTDASKAKIVLARENLQLETDQIFDKLVKIRRAFHQTPELAGNEKHTQETIKQYLLDLGLEVKTNIYGYGIVGILKGAKKGKSIAWRADMDALPNDFPDNVDFKSTIAGVQHGCGHDVHMAIALGIAEVLANHKKDLKGTVYFIFQPEEESFTGAKGLVENKLFSNIKPSEVYGLHITPFPVGQIIVKANEMYAYQKGIRIQFKNKLTKENLNSLTSKISHTLTRTINNSKPWELQHALDANDGLANPGTIYKDYFIMDENHIVNYADNDTQFLAFDVYETDKEKTENIIPAIKKIIESEGYAEQLVSVTIIKANPTIQNNPKLTAFAINTLDNMFGQGTVSLNYGQIPFSNDDFSYFQQQVPGVYFFLGASNFEKRMIAMIHAPDFLVDEECIRTGVKSFSYLMFERLKNK